MRREERETLAGFRFSRLSHARYESSVFPREDDTAAETEVLSPRVTVSTIQGNHSRLAPELTEKDAAKYMVTVITNCFQNIRSKMYDQLQYIQNDIPY